MSKFKYKGTDIEEIFDTNTGTISNVNFSPFPSFNTTSNANEKYKDNEIKLLGESFKTGNQDILTAARNFAVTTSSLQNTDGVLTMPPWANSVKIRVTGVKGGIGDTGEKGEGGDKGETGPNGAEGPDGDVGEPGGKGTEHQFRCMGNVTEEQHNGGSGGDGGDGGEGGYGGDGGNGGDGGDGGDGGEGGEGGNGGVNVFEDVFTVLNNNTVFNFQTGNDGNYTELNAQVDGQETLSISLQKGNKGHKGKKGYKGQKGLKGVQGLTGPKGYKGNPGNSGGQSTIGQHKEVGLFEKQQCVDGVDGGKGSKGSKPDKNTNKTAGIPAEVPGKNTAAAPSPDNSIKGIKGAVTTYSVSGTKTSNQTNINGVTFTNTQDTPSVELSFFVVDDTEN